MHFMCGDPHDRTLLFDVFNGGAATTPEQLGQTLGLPLAQLHRTGALQPASPRHMALRMLRNLSNMVLRGSQAAANFGPLLRSENRSSLVSLIEAIVGGAELIEETREGGGGDDDEMENDAA